MPFPLSILLLAVGVREAVNWQTLTCPYELKHESLRRIWCRQSSTECCTGLTFSQNARSVDGGKLKVTQGTNFFTVAVLEQSHGEGVYWCGVLSRNNTSSSWLRTTFTAPLKPLSGVPLAGFCYFCCPWWPYSPLFTAEQEDFLSKQKSHKMILLLTEL
ncbi:uncharacterized protein si:ch211-102c2.4 [Xiphias gladius]|uniref:uncharacterized protein si:ch211-102c2.4 n=1 Tax=Xiphias gladius TaxID=8245 RepID=UPI001A9A1BC6|nr:uncharacterized protein si:ch211-102c2.4 [Xiphias gladius]